MKRAACLFSPATALAQVFFTSASPRRALLLSGASYSGCCYSTYSSHHGTPVVVPQFLVPRGDACSRSTTSCLVLQQRSTTIQRRCVHQRAPVRRAPTGGTGKPGSGPPRPGGAPPRPNPAFRGSAGPRPSNSGGGGGSSGSMNKNRDNNSGGGGGKNASHVKYKLGRLPRDDEITHRYVILRQEDGSLSEPQPTDTVRAGINRRTESLVVLALPSAPSPTSSEDSDTSDAVSTSGGSGSGSLRFPICKVVDRAAERKAQADRTKEMRKKTVTGKELELNWAIDPHDLGHRLTKLRDFLERGLRVEVSMLRKGKGRGRRQATRDEAAELVRRVRETVAAVPGARETKNMEGELLRTAKLHLEGAAKEE